MFCTTKRVGPRRCCGARRRCAHAHAHASTRGAWLAEPARWTSARVAPRSGFARDPRPPCPQTCPSVSGTRSLRECHVWALGDFVHRGGFDDRPSSVHGSSPRRALHNCSYALPAGQGVNNRSQVGTRTSPTEGRAVQRREGAALPRIPPYSPSTADTDLRSAHCGHAGMRCNRAGGTVGTCQTPRRKRDTSSQYSLVGYGFAASSV